MYSFDGSTWDSLDYSFIEDVSSSDFNWVNQSSGIEIDFSQNVSGPGNQDCSEKECCKRGGRHSCSKPGTKACREKMRREKLNDSFVDLSSVLDLGKTAKTDKLAILTEAIRAVNQLRAETQHFRQENEKLHEEIKTLKADKNELREEKQWLKEEKQKMEMQLKSVTAASAPAPAGFISPHHPPAAYHHHAHPHPAEMSKMALVPSYGVYPMWHYLPSTTRDTSRDHVLRPPAA